MALTQDRMLWCLLPFTEVISWRWVLWVNVPVCIAIVVLVLTWVENTKDETVERVDWAGLVLVIASIGLSTYDVEQAPGWG